jgi:hypothetical protein
MSLFSETAVNSSKQRIQLHSGVQFRGKDIRGFREDTIESR